MTDIQAITDERSFTKSLTGPIGASHGIRKATWRERYAGQPRASKRLDYKGHEVRYHLDDHGGRWFVLADIFRALEKGKTSTLRKRIDRKDIMLVLAWVPNTANPEGGGGAMIQAANISGLEAMLSSSSLPTAPAFLSWAYGVVADAEGSA
ncbi:hypothetical protein [Polaromonas sp.]|uniref:hypothetical protein n=1 Tax=Polaromonas sp. TaxID=1869339 RepID=UPI003BAC8258